MRLYFCAIVTLVELLDTSFVSSIVGKILEDFHLSFDQLSTIYVSLALGACLSLPISKYFYRKFDLKRQYQVLLIALIINFVWAFFSSNWTVFCILRMCQGFTITLLYSLSFLDVVTKSNNKEKDLNFVTGISVIGTIFGPALGGFMTLIGWKFIFILFASILGGLLVYIWNKDIEHDKIISKMNKYDILEYVCFVVLITIGSLIMDNTLSFKFIPLGIIAGVIIVLKYRKFEVNFIFNKQIFNKYLLISFLVHLLCRFSIIGFLPLLSSLLYKHYDYSSLEISFLLTLVGIASLITKILYRQPDLFRANSPTVFFIYMGLVSVIALAPFKYFILFTVILFFWGMFSSVLFNYVNNCIFYNQDTRLSDDLSVMLTIIQMLLYGLCTSVVFKFYSQMLTTFKSPPAALALVVLFLVYLTAMALHLYNKYFTDLKKF